LAGENRGSIQFSYSSARVEDSGLLLVDNESFGGLVGTNNHGVVLLSYWNAEVSSLSYSTAGKGKTTEQMMNADTFSGWGYTGKWVIDDGNDYPRLAWEGLEGGPFLDDPNRYAGGVGTPDDPYRIQTPDEFVRLAYHPTDWGKSFVLAGNIDLSQTDPSLISPIGVYGMPFKGSFDGNNCTISNFRHLSEAENYVGVFGSIGPEISYRSYGPMTHDPNDSGSVVNLNLENVQVLGYCCAGGLAGYNSGVISNCSVTGNVTAVSKDAGGLLGFSDGRVTDCSARGNVISGQVAGGLIAHNKGPVKNCSFYGSVENRSRCSGGLIGYNYNTVESCHFAGDITGTHDTGGLIGSNGGTVVRCSTLGSVTGDWCVGGLIGRNFGNLLNCCAMGSANGVEYVAGLIGINDKPVASCYSSCAVTGQHKTGGLVGTRNPGGEVSNSFWDVETSGQIMSAGGLGKTTAEMQMASTFLDAGWDFVAETANGPNDVWKMWDGYDYPRLAWEAGPDTPLVFVDVNDPGFHGQMSKYEVTNAQYCDFLNAALASGDISINGTKVEGADGSNSGQDHVGQLYYNGDGSGYTGYGATNGGAARIRHDAGAFGVEDGFDNHPVTYVSWYGAMAFANYYGYYLPAEDQWQAVANYDGTYIYGCGETIDPDIANYRVSEHPDGTMPVGSFGAYGHGMSDMAGNVWEWTSTSLSSNRVFRGGSLGSVESDCAVSIRGDGIPHVAYWDIGFRVCR
jgi:hypothetical protein